jgi:hypothetical protein
MSPCLIPQLAHVFLARVCYDCPDGGVRLHHALLVGYSVEPALPAVTRITLVPTNRGAARCLLPARRSGQRPLRAESPARRDLLALPTWSQPLGTLEPRPPVASPARSAPGTVSRQHALPDRRWPPPISSSANARLHHSVLTTRGGFLSGPSPATGADMLCLPATASALQLRAQRYSQPAV